MTTNDCRVCRVCEQEKPLTEFYKRHNGDPHSMCSQCHREYNAGRKQVSRRVAINKSEILVIDRLIENRIPASPGKTLGYRWADVVAWGCVLIECKLSSNRGSVFSWNFSPLQQEQGLRAHLVILCADYGSEITYHVFDTHDPIFAHRDGKRKTGVIYMLNPKHRKGDETVLTKDIMSAHKDKWGMVEQYRLDVSTHLSADPFLADWRIK